MLDRASQATPVEARLYLRVAPRSRVRARERQRARETRRGNTHNTAHAKTQTKFDGAGTSRKARDRVGRERFSEDTRRRRRGKRRRSSSHHVRVSRRRDGGVVARGGVEGVPVPAACGRLVAAVLPLAVLEVGALGLSDAAPEAVGLGRKHEAAAGGAVPVPGAGRGAARAVVVAAAAAAAAGVPAAAATTAPAAAAAVLVPAAAAVLSRARREGESGERVSAREEKRAKRKALPTAHVGQKKTRRSIWRKRPTAARVSLEKLDGSRHIFLASERPIDLAVVGARVVPGRR